MIQGQEKMVNGFVFNDENATPIEDYPNSSTTVVNISYKKIIHN